MIPLQREETDLGKFLEHIWDTRKSDAKNPLAAMA